MHKFNWGKEKSKTEGLAWELNTLVLALKAFIRIYSLMLKLPHTRKKWNYKTWI